MLMSFDDKNLDIWKGRTESPPEAVHRFAFPCAHCEMPLPP